MMKKIWTLMFLVLVYTFAIAQKVNINEAGRAAENFYNTKINNNGILGKNIPNMVKCYTIDSDTVMFVFNVSNNGYVIMSANKSICPVLAYSMEGNFRSDQVSPELSYMLELYSNEIKYAINNNNDSFNNEWDNLLSGDHLVLQKKATKDISPLLTTKWDQGSGYNYHCPLHTAGPGGKCYAGCVATAMAQVMKYHNWPEHGLGSHSYQHPYYGTISADFASTTYNWSSMTNSLNTNSREAISTLIFHCGVSVDMDYTPTGSGALTSMAKDALKNFFHYRSNIKVANKNSYTKLNWRKLIMSNLDDGYPVLYSGSGSSGGHAWVCDGYADTLFHMNWGWSGYNNGYFRLESLNSGNGDFSSGQSAIVNIIPYFAPYCRQNKVITDTMGILSDGSAGSYYWNNSVCDWIISPPNATSVILNFTDFQTEAGKDFVTVYDGESTSGILLGTYSGNDLPPALIAASGKAFITFSSDSAIQDFGWELNFNSTKSGIDENIKEQEIKIYPVPATDDLNIILGAGISGDVNISIYDITGQKLETENRFITNQQTSKYIGNLHNGIYFLKIITDRNTMIKKFIKQ
jgi:hypothetical protein